MAADSHAAWLVAHRDALASLGVPFRVFETAERWDNFLQNGRLHWHEDGGRFDVDDLPADARRRLHRWLERHCSQDGPDVLRLLRVRAAPDVPPEPRWVPTTAPEALGWLRSRGAHPWLVRHHELVVEAAGEVLGALRGAIPGPLDDARVTLGAALHDAGKMEHEAEMSAPGAAHELAGEAMLLREGFAPAVARICVTHAAWSEPRAELEDRLVALADKLWKGKRDADLERALVDELAARRGEEAWAVFGDVDAACERVAADGPERLRRSVV